MAAAVLLIIAGNSPSFFFRQEAANPAKLRLFSADDAGMHKALTYDFAPPLRTTHSICTSRALSHLHTECCATSLAPTQITHRELPGTSAARAEHNRGGRDVTAAWTATQDIARARASKLASRTFAVCVLFASRQKIGIEVQRRVLLRPGHRGRRQGSAANSGRAGQGHGAVAEEAEGLRRQSPHNSAHHQGRNGGAGRVSGKEHQGKVSAGAARHVTRKRPPSVSHDHVRNSCPAACTGSAASQRVQPRTVSF